MEISNSQYFFEVSNGPHLENTFAGRLLCVKDFLKRVATLPFALLYKVYRTLGKGVGVAFSALFVLLTVGSSPAAREFFLRRITAFTKDLADWIFFPFAVVGCFLRLLMALAIHPTFYFNALC